MSVITLTKENFENEVKESEKPMLIDFWASWCMPCRMLAPTISTLADEYDGKVKVGKVNIDESPSIASQYGVMSIPTVILFKDGKPVGQKVGMADKKAYEQMIQSAN